MTDGEDSYPDLEVKQIIADADLMSRIKYKGIIFGHIGTNGKDIMDKMAKNLMGDNSYTLEA